MKLTVVALDYDGTTARGDVLDPAVRNAIAEMRTSGVITLLVTGRILTELQRVAGSLHFVDGVVAENGAVVHFADRGHTAVLSQPLPDALLKELVHRGIPHRAGQCLVDADARDAPKLLAIIRELELPFVLAFNRSRVMMLPQGVSKATGLQTALETLRLSSRNLLSIGDAENDHELLRLAEVGVAVEWGSRSLRDSADVVVQGAGPPAVADYLRGLADTRELPRPERARRRLRLGFTDDGAEFSLAVRGRNVLVTGDAMSGKSWVAGLLCEQLILQGYSVCVLDPEGDYRTLEALPRVTVMGGDAPPPTVPHLLQALRYPERSIVVDLSHLPHQAKLDYVRSALPELNRFRRQTGLPHRILIDEAHYFLHDADAETLLDLDTSGYTVATYWASRLPAALLQHTEVMIVTRESNPRELEALRQLCAGCHDIEPGRWEVLRHLKPGQAVALPITQEAAGSLRLFTIGSRLTSHVRHQAKYVDVPVTEHYAFYFAASGGLPARRARTLREFVAIVESTPDAELEEYFQRGDFSRWVAGVFGDVTLAGILAGIEAQHRESPSPQTVRHVLSAIKARYELAVAA